MESAISSKIMRKIIFDILIERSKAIDDDCDELIKKDMEEFGAVGDYAGEVGWTACGTRVLADDILDGIMSLEEAVEVLTSEERREAKARCQKWLEEKDYKEFILNKTKKLIIPLYIWNFIYGFLCVILNNYFGSEVNYLRISNQKFLYGHLPP